MPQKVLKFTGINRKVNEFQNTGACEELINLRPTMSGLEVAKTKAQKFENANYDIYTHSFGDRSLFIGVVPENNFQLYIIDDDGETTMIDEFNGYGPEYSIAFIGNKILLTHGTDLRVYSYKNNRYEKEDAKTPDLDIRYTVSAGYGYSEETNIASSDPRSNEFKAEAQKHWSAALGQNSRVNEAFGPVLVAFNYSLNDGSEFWTNKWVYVNPFLYLPTGENGKNMIYYENGDTKRFTFRSFGINFTITKIESNDSDIINAVNKINVYATRPVFPYSTDSLSAVTNNVHDREIYARVASMSDLGINKQLLYFQKSISVTELESGNVTFTLDFGASQAGEKVLEVDNGPVKRIGEMVAFNNRAHVYNSYAIPYPQSVVCLSDSGYDFQNREAYVYIETNNETLVLETTALVPALANSSISNKIICCYPDARASKILIQRSEGGTSFYTVNLKSSERYNYAWGESNDASGLVDKGSIVPTSILPRESNTINVSAQYNPFVFPVEYSYSLGGKIIDLVTSYLPISSTQVSQYPLTAFTSNGIFALEQGGGTSLYSNITPLQPLVINGKALPTPYGTFFVSSKSLYVLSGREVANASTALNGKLEDTIKEQASYKKLCCTPNGIIYNFMPLLSKEDFEAFITNATLAYDQLRNELYICSNDESIPYSYVFNLDTKAFHKISKRYTTNQNGARYAIETVGGNRNVIDLHSEVDSDRQPILLQSRPMSLEAVYTHIQRLMLMVDAKLSSEQYLFFSVFGSDNLYDWKCVISAQKSNTVLRQIRTNRAAKSYKDYIVLINGVVGSDTDLSDIIADYTVVNRRLG